MIDLVVNDEEYLYYKTELDSLATVIESKLDYFVEQLNYVAESGIRDGSVHDNLVAFIGSLEPMRGQLTYFTDEMSKAATDFVEEIEILDVDIYNGGN